MEIRLDRVWQEVFGAGAPAGPPGAEAYHLEHGPVSHRARRLELEGARAMRIEALGPRVVRAAGPVGMEQLRAALRFVLVRAIAPLGGFLVHAAALEVGEGAHLCFGPPEVGKTTLAGNAGARAITEESALVFPTPEGWRLCGTPWWSDGGRPGRSEVYPLTRIAWLEQAAETRFERRPASEVLSHLAGQIYAPGEAGGEGEEARLRAAQVPSLLRLLSEVEHGRLRFTRDAVYAG
ncbi:MAG: hypothetical protein P1V51_14575 [Deltaproteobacteria bacterium]|nr:hypothetical protein [Deltaproteobacteria bacterium]